MKVWIGGIVALVAVGLAIYFATRGGDDEPARPSGPAATPTTQSPPAPPAAPSLPSAPGSATTAPHSDDSGNITYKVDGVTVTDHRGSNAGPPMDLPPNMHAPGMRTIQVSVVSSFSKEIRRVTQECSRDVAPNQRTPHSRIEGEIVIAIKDNKATVTKSLMQVRDTNGDIEPLRQCVEQKATGITVDGQGEADLDAYSIHLQTPLLGR